MMRMVHLPLLLLVFAPLAVAFDKPHTSSHAAHHLLRGGQVETTTRILQTCPSLQTDEFDCSLDSSVWTEYDPLGDTPVSTATGTLVIDVPSGGTPKNMWSGSENTAPRVYQTMQTPNEDFDVEVKFGTLPVPAETYNDHGVFVRVDDSTFLRFSSFSNSNKLYLFISYICSSSTETYHHASTGGKVYDRMRVVKVGNTITLSAGDASQFDLIEEVSPESDHGGCPAPSALGGFTGVGVFAGNGNKNINDFKATFEYFKVYCNDGTTEANVISCGGPPTPTEPPTEPTTEPPQEPSTAPPTDPLTDAPVTTDPPLEGFSDTFTGTTTPLEDTWTIIDPVGDCVVSKDGSSLIYEVPSGNSHDLWTGSLNLAPRVFKQVFDPSSLAIQAKFESITCEHNQLQGLIVMKSVDEFLRYGMHNKDGAFKLFFAKISPSGAVVYKNIVEGDGSGVLRLERNLDVWTAKYAPVLSDTFQTVHTQVVENFQANYVGTYAGNHDPNPAFVASVDYFMIDTDPVIDSDDPVTELMCTNSEVIEVWSGLNMEYGGDGHAQNWLNILGMVPHGTTSLSYSMTSTCGSSFDVTNPGTCGVRISSDGKRLHASREFNVEIFVDDLCEGLNFVELVVEGVFAQTATVTIDYQKPSSVLALPFSVDWDEDQPLCEVGQMVDGHWGVEAGTNTIRTLNVGYDKIFAIGDRDWPANYEVLTSMTRHNSGNSIGIGMGWIGHWERCTVGPCECYPTDEKLQWKWPLETITWVRNGNSFQVWTYNNNSNVPVSGGSTSVAGLSGMGSDEELVLGQYYYMRSRIQQIDEGGSPYNHVQTKIWKDGEVEPVNWHMDVNFPNEPVTQGKGAIFLLSFNTDASWGPVSITPVPPV